MREQLGMAGLTIRGGAFFVMALAAGVGLAQADMTFTLGNVPQANEENILLNSGDTGATVFGTTNQSGLSVSFSSIADTLSAPSSGNARIEAVDGLLNDVTIGVPGGTFTDLILNPFQGTGNATLTVLLIETDGSTLSSSFTYALGNGQNFVTLVALNGELIKSVNLNAPGGFSDLRQPRISGASTAPAPSTLVMSSILFGMLGIVWTGKRLKRFAAAA